MFRDLCTGHVITCRRLFLDGIPNELLLLLCLELPFGDCLQQYRSIHWKQRLGSKDRPRIHPSTHCTAAVVLWIFHPNQLDP